MRRTKAEAEQTRNAILDAAETVFFERGVSQTSLSHIAAKAHCTRGAIYWHFTGKAALFAAMRERAYLPQEEFFNAQNLLSDPEPVEALQRVTLESVRRFVRDDRARRVYAILVLRCEYVGEMETAMDCQREDEERMRCNLLAVFEAAERLGKLDPAWTPSAASHACVGLVTGLFTQWMRQREEFDIESIAALACEGLFSRFKPALAAAPQSAARPVAAALA